MVNRYSASCRFVVDRDRGSYLAVQTGWESMRKPRRIGVFDSGLGGLTVLRALIRAFPSCSFVYLGDTARTPYGSKSPEAVIRYSVECAEFLSRHSIDLLVVACNTATSLAIEAVRGAVQCPVVGTIEPSLDEWERLGAAETLLIIGTRATIRSMAYQHRIAARFPHRKFHAIACPLFVPLVEEGIFEGALVDQVVKQYLSEFKTEGIHSLMLACTHYPLLKASLQKFFGPNVSIIDSAEAIARAISQDIDPQVTGDTGDRVYYVTDEATRFSELAGQFLGNQALFAEKVAIPSL